MKKTLVCLLAAGLLVACQSEEAPVSKLSGTDVIQISPSITRVSGLQFEDGDQIGVTVTMSGETYATNECLTYSSATSVFSSESLTWKESDGTAALTAYYPYSADGLGSSYTVAADQSTAELYEATDLMTASVSGVTPSTSAVAMTFSHKLAKVTVKLTNNSDATVSSVVLGGSIPTATVSNLALTVDETGTAADITTLQDTDTTYSAVIVPQTVALTVALTTSDSKTYSVPLDTTALAAGVQYSVVATLSASGLTIGTVTSGSDDEGDDTEEDNSLYDETCVYANPAGTFYSSSLSSYATSTYYNADTDLLMTRKSSATASASSHPTSTYADAGWYLLAADEFSPISRGWSYAVDAIQTEYTVSYSPLQNTRNGWASQDIDSEKVWCELSTITGSDTGNGTKFKYTTDVQEGQTSYLRFWSTYLEAVSGGKYIGSNALYSCPSGTAIPRWTTITSDTRVEIRARIRGNRQGFNSNIKLITNTGNDNGVNEYVTVMSNPASSASDTTSIVQGVNSGNTVTTTFDPYDWAIYWVEVYTDKVVLGINGKTTATIEYSDLPLDTGMRLVLSQGVGYNEDNTSGSDEPTWIDESLKSITFTESITSDIVPHMDIDWIRIWGNEDWTGGSLSYGNANGVLF